MSVLKDNCVNMFLIECKCVCLACVLHECVARTSECVCVCVCCMAESAVVVVVMVVASGGGASVG